ncbi:CGNR zinc finger domain-containing protein [Streptomyces sp. NPDC051018]|uniref:CGNR zinc finger domain-containing protein n=1 Tax=Streptomyces sp. NPDC051018 TaxID=3365639 RepID=UPI0037909D1A
MQAVAARTAALVNALTGGDPAPYPGPDQAPDRAPDQAPDQAPDPDPEAIAGVLRAHGETGRLRVSSRDVTEMRTAAGKLREVFAARSTGEAAEMLNTLLPENTGRLRLSSHHGASPWHPHLDSDDDAPWGEWLLASSCLALTVLVWDRQRPPGGVCASSACRNVFLTQGSGPVRRYCSRRCATRERVAAHRRARRAAAAPE